LERIRDDTHQALKLFGDPVELRLFTVHLPKSERAKPKQIEVNVA
jgi:hypothetical protein